MEIPMHLTISPQSGIPGQPETTLHVAGDTLTLGGVPYDLSDIAEGDVAEWPDSPIIGPIRRIGGVIHATVRVQLGPTAANDQPADPAHWAIPDAEGDVVIPAVRRP
jgi:hypothetical protein